MGAGSLVYILRTRQCVFLLQHCDLKVTSVVCRCEYVAHLLLWGTVVWTIHDGRVRRVNYKGNDRRVNSVPKKRDEGRVRNHFPENKHKVTRVKKNYQYIKAKDK